MANTNWENPIQRDAWEAHYRGLAKARQDDELEVDDDAKVSMSEHGAWVQAWVWIPKEGGIADEVDERDQGLGARA